MARRQESCESSLIFTDTIHSYTHYQLEEKKKIEQIRKEKEEERQLQELQRFQDEQTGKKPTEKLKWLYATPATGSSLNPNDSEDHLLGKKSVEKILTADDNAEVSSPSLRFSIGRIGRRMNGTQLFKHQASLPDAYVPIVYLKKQAVHSGHCNCRTAEKYLPFGIIFAYTRKITIHN